ncbi:MAG: hypothetical protein QOK83_08780 [Nitrososphaeraceae archaeon]|nr:hypothetical protein [Nitrososphaeraceae archaeon]
MTFPVNIRAGWIQVTISPQKKFDNPETFDEIINPEELSSCWTTLKHIVDRIVEEQIDRSKSAVLQNAKTRSIVDIYNSLIIKKEVDQNVLLKEVLKTGNFSEEEAKSLIKKVKEEKIEGGMAWY